MTFWMFLEQLEKANLLRFGRVWKNYFAQSNQLPHTYWSSLKYVQMLKDHKFGLNFLIQCVFKLKKLANGTEFQNSFD